MGMQIRLGGSWQTITAAQVFFNGAWKSLKTIQVYANGAWRQVANFTTAITPISLAIAPSPFAKGAAGPLVTSGNIVATPTGGSAPYTYVWTVVSSSPSPVTINSPTSASTTVTGDITNGNISCTLKCVVTDSLSSTANATVNGSLIFKSLNFGGTQ